MGGGKIVLIINYFGLVDTRCIAQGIKAINNNVIIIEDDVQALFSFLTERPVHIDFRFTSLRKSLAIPDGGLIDPPIGKFKEECKNVFAQYKTAAGILKANNKNQLYDDSIYLQLFEKGEDILESEYESCMSQLSHALFLRADIEDIKSTRKLNAAFIYSELQKLGVKTLLPYNDDLTPLFVPIYLEDRNKVRRAMFSKQVYCPLHWPLNGQMGKLLTGGKMAEHELSIIVDQRYNLEDMQLIIDIIKENI